VGVTNISVARLALHRNSSRRTFMKLIVKTLATVALVAAAFTSIGTGGEALAGDRGGSHFEGYHGGYHFWRDHDRYDHDRDRHRGYDYDRDSHRGYEGCRDGRRCSGYDS
jgi:hypothetical protein